MRTKLILGTVVFAGSFAAAWMLRQRQIRIVDTTSPDPFGDAVLRENL
jgi:hypothetical protein